MTKYVIYKGTEGLINMLGGIVYCISWCIENNHKLLIDCICNPHFNMNFSKIFYIKDFEFIEDYNLLKDVGIDEINKLKNNSPILEVSNIRNYYVNNELVSKSLYKWNPDSKIKIYCGNGGNSRQKINRFIRINNEVLEKIIKYDLNNNYEKYLAIHFRNTDIKNNINNFTPYFNDYENIYFATDDKNTLEDIEMRFPNKNIICFSEPIDESNKGMHYLKENKYDLVFNLLVDIYILVNSDKFIGSPNSSISRLVFYMINNGNNIFNFE